MSQNRRSFLATLGGATLGLAYGSRSLEAMVGAIDRRAKLSRIGIQLYTLRKVASADLAGTLGQLGKIGYREVEFAGYYNHSPSDVRAMLDHSGLTAPSAHIAIEQLEGDAAAKTFADAKVVGHEWVTVPSLPRLTTADDWKRMAQRFNTIASQAKSAGFRFAYHNHNAEFRRVGDTIPLEILLAETDPSLVSFEMDIYWVVNGGGNPVDLLTRHPGRFKMLHVKDSMGPPDHKMADVGAGTIDFKSIFARAKGGGIEHYFVEHDQPVDPMAFAKNSFDHLSKLEY